MNSTDNKYERHTFVFDLKNDLENSPEPVRFLWNCIHEKGDGDRTILASIAAFGHSSDKPFAVITDKQESVDFCRRNGIWFFDIVENPEVAPFGVKKLVAYDIDGTLADISVSGRRKFLAPRDPVTGKKISKGFKENWAAFNAAVIHDGVHEQVAYFFRAMRERADTDCLIITARMATPQMLADTTKWLKNNDLDGYVKMYIRDDGDFRGDGETKLDLLKRIEADFGRRPDFIVDDRYSVTTALRDAGVFVANVCQDGKAF